MSHKSTAIVKDIQDFIVFSVFYTQEKIKIKTNSKVNKLFASLVCGKFHLISPSLNHVKHTNPQTQCSFLGCRFIPVPARARISSQWIKPAEGLPLRFQLLLFHICAFALSDLQDRKQDSPVCFHSENL